MSKQKLLIGLSGKMGVGKSTISYMMQVAFEGTGLKVERVSNSAAIYKCQDVIYDTLGLTLEGEKDRALLIEIGKWGRSKNPDFWLEQTAKFIHESDADVIICDDVRFPNEADMFDRLGFLCRIEGEQRGQNVDNSKSQDITETALDDYNFEHRVSNEASPAEMIQQILTMMGAKDESEEKEV